MKILVTGGTVFVSKFTAQCFAAKGYEVYVLNRNTKPQLKNVKLIECDRRAVGDKLKDLHFDAVIDVTAYDAHDINSLLDGLESFGSYVFISSSAVYPDTLKVPFKETDGRGANRFWGGYGTNKIAAEDALIPRVPKAYIIRPPYLYGEYNNVYREAFVFDCADKNEPFYLPKDGAMPLQFFYVGDLCAFIEKLLKVNPEQKIFNVGNPPVTVKEWVESCYAAAGKKPEFRYVTDGTEQRRYFPFYDYSYVLDVTAQNALLPNLTPLEEGLRKSYEWYTNNRGEVKAKDYAEYIRQNFQNTNG